MEVREQLISLISRCIMFLNYYFFSYYLTNKL